jgi:hypothetical protein
VLDELSISPLRFLTHNPHKNVAATLRGLSKTN